MSDREISFKPLALALTVGAALLRLAPHPPNFAPVGSVALFGGARLRGWQAYLVPLLAMLLTDPLLSHRAGYPVYSWATPIIYTSFLINVALGRIFLQKPLSAVRVATVALAGSIQFYLLTNLFEWWFGIAMYPHNWSGLITCYVAALPFFGRTLLADLFYSVVLFSVYALASARFEHRAASR